jgi:ribosomal protein L11 methyltransferase
MKPDSLWQVSVRTTAEAEEAVAAWLEKLFTQPASVYCDEKTKVSTVSIYCSTRPAWPQASHRAVLAGLRQIKAAGLNIGSGRMAVKKLPRENWAESWKRHFKPIEIGDRLLVKPSWSRRRARKGQAEVVLDPGLSFGTGQHPTTAFCLRQLVCCRKRGQPQCFLDIGTGSGILAIAAAKLGFAPVVAFDYDREAVRVARENARQNRVLKRLRLYRADLKELPVQGGKKFDLICANLLSPLLIGERKRLVNRLRRGGVLVLAGILRREFAEVRQACESLGLILVASRSENEWRSGAFVRPELFY